MDDEEKCCGSGCNNCILDKPSKQITAFNKCNIFNQKIYHRFVVESVTSCTPDVCRYTFKYSVKSDEDVSTMTLNVPPGYHLMLRAPCAPSDIVKDKYDKTTKEHYISRPYTPISINSILLSFQILVKFEVNGIMSNYLKDLKFGDLTEWKGVYGDFEHQIPNSFKYLICVCHGVAISPIYRIISEIVENDNDDTIVLLLACFKNLNSILLRDEIQELRCYWNFKSKIYLSNERSCECADSQCKCLLSNLKYNEEISKCRLDKKELSSAFIGKDQNKIRTLICGTEHFINQMQRHLHELNVQNENIFIFK